jgi:hypothetical protein
MNYLTVGRLCLASFLSLVLSALSFNVSASSDTEKACFSETQGKVPWTSDKDMNWDPKNVEQLCKGTEKPTQPGQCFNTIMNGHVNWGKSTEWEWQNAINLCSGSNDAEKTVQCFKNSVTAGKDWREGIMACKNLK